MTTRLIITALLLALAAPLSAEADQARKLFQIGLLGPGTPKQAEPFVALFKQRMREHGWIEDEHFVLIQRWAAGKHDRIPDLAADLVRSNATVIVAWSTPAIIATKRATSTIPIVMGSSADAVGLGLVASLSRPGGNVTGGTVSLTELTMKQVEVVRELMPGMSRLGVLYDPTNPADQVGFRGIPAATKLLGLQTEPLEARNLPEIESAFAGLRKKGVEALLVLSGGVNFVHRERIFELAATSRLPAIYPSLDYAKEGGLISYGGSIVASTRVAADYVDKILRGRAPADLPVEQPKTFELTINLKTAKALGLTIPPSLLLRADQVIE